ncbi:hypothetical protein MMC30_000157 [Trapelia coarctata]|nr:hypothetical protein [Trapelia coarctata]
MRFLLASAVMLLPLLASAQSHIYARNPYAYAEAEPYAYAEAEAYAEADPYAYAYADAEAYAEAYPFAYPGNSGSKQTKVTCDASADKTCTQGKPCKTGVYTYDGNHPYREHTARTCTMLCDCK